MNDDTKSPIREMDPFVRALNTIIYGVIIHYTTMLVARNDYNATESCETRGDADSWFPSALLFHEYWIYLQHSNVLGNPLCQRLDRQYGIALLRSNQHWSIAGTLSAYWCREMISLFLCLPFVSEYTRYLVLYSLIYHTIKSRGIRKDAIQRHSSTFGIMRQVIDKFYHHSATESIVTVVRLMLQGVDTLIHALVIRDIIQSKYIGEGNVNFLQTLFIIWVLHAAFNQYFLCSTATFMVQTWYALSTKSGPRSSEGTVVSVSDSSGDETESDSENDSTEGHADGGKFIVRSLLRPGRVSEKLKGKQGAASSGVDTAIRIETTLAIIASVYTFGFADAPLRILLLPSETLEAVELQELLLASVPYSWLLMTSILAAILMFLPPSKGLPNQRGGQASWSSRRRYLINTLDVLIIVVGTYQSGLSMKAKAVGLLLGAGLAAKSFLKASRCNAPRLFWKFIGIVEVGTKVFVGRLLVPKGEADAAVIGAIVTIFCAVYGVLLRSDFDNDHIQKPKTVADVTFLGHPAELHDCWALWLLPYSLNNRWQRPWWSVPLWPLHYLVGYYTCNWRPKFFGDGASFFGCDDVIYGDIHMQTWTSCHFGRHFFTSQGAVKRNIEATARHAERSGLKVLTLGALNKAEGINRGGASVALALGPQRKLSIIHGNHLTAAAVVETTRQCFGKGAKVFLTGASSKVGWAVAQALKDRFKYEVLCHSTDEARREIFRQKGFAAASTLEEGMAFTNLWIVGKYDRAVAQTIPQGSTAIVFAVPHPLHARADVRVVEAGNLHVDLSRFDRPRRFTNKLAAHEIFACHAAGVVAAHRLKQGRANANGRIDEIGPVDPNTMDSWLEDAKELGFTVPSVQPVDTATTYPHDVARYLAMGMPSIVIVGAGPSGLAVAASLRIKGIQSIILEEQAGDDSYGSWDKHFTHLEVTTSKAFCTLPGYPMSDKYFPGEYVTATQYRKYLRMYADRFQLDIRRGQRVKDIVRGNETSSWIVQFDDGEGTTMKSPPPIPASAVVVATGKHRVPRLDAGDGLLGKLKDNGIEAVHSTDMRSPEVWSKATKAAEKGRLCIVGFGNSAVDITAHILQTAAKRDSEEEEDQFCIHIATRTVPPIFPRRKGIFRIDSIGRYVRLLPSIVQEAITKVLWWGIPESSLNDTAFPPTLPRWTELAGRVPVIDKSGSITRGFKNGNLVGHGPVKEVLDDSYLQFLDGPTDATSSKNVPIDFVVLATGYKKDCIITREDRLNGLFLCGFGHDKFLPIRSIGEEAQAIAREIETNTQGSILSR